MLKLYHSPYSRASGIVSLLRAMGKETEIQIETVHIQRQDGSGHKDPHNPHPEGKVPLLEVDGHFVRESAAIMLWLTDHFDSPLGRGITHPARADYLSWLFYYGNVMEPVLYLTAVGLADNDMIKSWCRDQATVMETLKTALSTKDFLVDDTVSAADLLASAPFHWFPDLIADAGPVRDWYDRCRSAVDGDFLSDFDAAAMEQLGLPPMPTAATDA